MQLADWLAYQQAQHPKAIELGLDRVREVASRLGLLPWIIPSVIVGGTNGKGSTVAFLTVLARAGRCRVGTYTSPHLLRYNERVAIDQQPVDDELLVRSFERIESARAGVALTFFEYGTLAALDVFKSQAVDVAMIEVGLGGRLDATNIIDADVAVLTSVGLDHQEWLGPTREDIGREKSGIFRAGHPVILGSPDLPRSVHQALATLRCQARWMDADFRVQPIAAEGSGATTGESWMWRGWDQNFGPLPLPALIGPVQPHNAAAAIAASVELVRVRADLRNSEGAAVRIDDALVAEAMRGVRLRGRFERIAPITATDPEWILDVAHNEDSARVLAQSLRTLARPRRTFGVLGVLGDKDAATIASELDGVVDEWVLCGLDGPRGGSAEALRARLPASVKSVALAPDVAHGCAVASALADAGDRIVVFGSFHVVGPALEWLRL